MFLGTNLVILFSRIDPWPYIYNGIVVLRLKQAGYFCDDIRTIPRKNPRPPPGKNPPPLFCSSGRLDLMMAPQAKILVFEHGFLLILL